MNYMGRLCRALLRNEEATQRQLAAQLGISIGKCNALVKQTVAAGYIRQEKDRMVLTPEGIAYMQQFRVKNAIIQASRIDVRFLPLHQKVPKGLMEVEGERLVERLIRQLQQAGIHDITVLVGFLAERYEYLADKFGVKLLYNHEYAKSNLASMYLLRHMIGNTYLLAPDYYLPDGFFETYEPDSWFGCHYIDGTFDGVGLHTDAKRRVREVQIGGANMLVRRGPVYLKTEFMQLFSPVVQVAYENPALGIRRWEDLLNGKLDHLQLYAREFAPDVVCEFESYEDLRDFDINYARSAGKNHLQFIANALAVPKEEIGNIHWIETNAVNHVFHFEVQNKQYVLRIPGNRAGRFISYKQEFNVYRKLEKLALSDTCVYMDVQTGLKISEFFPYAPVYPQARQQFDSLLPCIQLRKCLHEQNIHVRQSFNIEKKLDELEKQCKAAGCIHFEDYDTVRGAMRPALDIIRMADVPKVLCHLNASSSDHVCGTQGNLCLAHWEFSGMCHPLADVAMLALQAGCNVQQLETLLCWYLERAPEQEEKMLTLAYMAAGGLLWSLWGEYRLWCGEDYAGFAIRMYRAAKHGLQALHK